MLQVFTRMNRTTMNVLKPAIVDVLERLPYPLELNWASPDDFLEPSLFGN